ncbi:hypothetical protein JTE90_021554 [Oedothorax gibbosus]|uniref:C-factor n=1 Tax=Oedothorax gibbosus TaxID=931172 RepID=A0AAV6VNL2_9ARAC|nr:hypothetical protein JTE90_021554 [Oedothorax gibbosus]
MAVESVLVTGANRGIGLEFVKQFLKLDDPPRFVFAACRNPGLATDLLDLKKESKNSEIILIQLDVTNLEEIQAAKKEVEKFVGNRGLTLLINNAGSAALQGFPGVTKESFFKHFDTNAVGPFLLMQELYPLLQKAASLKESEKLSVSRAAVINISAGNGSLTTAMGLVPVIDAAVGYRTSKAAVNMAMRIVSRAMKKDGVLNVQICPGWVKTDMGSPAAEIEVPDSIAAMLKTMLTLNENNQGDFLDRNGVPIPF